jgi:hypothetical protein
MGGCVFSPSNPPVTKARWPSWIPRPGCWRTRSSARSTCTGSMGAWCRSWPRAITSSAAAAHGRTDARAGGHDFGGPVRRGVHRRSRPDRGAADGRGAGPLAGLCLGHPGGRCAPSGRASARAAARGRATAAAASRAAGVRGSYDADRRGAASAATTCLARPATMPRARPSTNPPSSWACLTPAARNSRGSRFQAAPMRFALPRPMLDRPGLEFSFSGLKTAVRLAVEQGGDAPMARAPTSRRGAGSHRRYADRQDAARAGADRPSRAGGGRRRRRQSHCCARSSARGPMRWACACIIRASNSVPTTRR